MSTESATGINSVTDPRPYAVSIPDLSTHFKKGFGSFEGYVPSTIVERDEFLPFKEEWTNELVKDLRKTRTRDGWGNGQDSPMLAAFITSELVPSIEVYDGLHRQVANIIFQSEDGIEIGRPTTVISVIGNTAVHFVTIKPMSRYDMLDKRLANTANHPELRFARGGLWTSQLWYLDEISKLAPELSAKQAFQLAERWEKSNANLGRNLGISPEVVDLVVEWALERAHAWSVDPSTIYKWIHRAEATTPEIIARVRNVGKGAEAQGEITEDMITSLSRYMAGEAYHLVHRLVIDFAQAYQLTAIQFNNLLAEIKNPIHVSNPSDPTEVEHFLKELEIDTLVDDEKLYASRRIRQRSDIYNRGSGAIASIRDAIDRVAESLDVRDERPDFIPSIDQREAAIKAAEALEEQAEKAKQLAERARNRAGLNGEIAVSKSHSRFPSTSSIRPPIEISSAPKDTSSFLQNIRDRVPRMVEAVANEDLSPGDIENIIEIIIGLAEAIAANAIKA